MNAQPYSVYYAQQLEEAVEFQDYVASLFYDMGLVVVQYGSRRYQFERGENSGGIEIKYDKRRASTGNVYIECEEKSDPANPYYVPSGIYRLDNSWLYAIGDYEIVYVFSKKLLQGLHRIGRYEWIELPTSKGFLLPELDATKYAATILRGK